MRRPRFYRGLNPRERALMWPVFRASLPSLYDIGIGEAVLPEVNVLQGPKRLDLTMIPAELDAALQPRRGLHRE